MKLLKNSGLPIYLNEDNGRLLFEAPLKFDGFSTKYLKQMDGLFVDNSQNSPDEEIYDVYRDIVYDKDRQIYTDHEIRYDITVVKPGLIGDERKKTSGHYHQWNIARTYSYPEVYEVISGTAIYVLQRADNFETKNLDDLDVEDIIVVKVEAGQSIIVPPNYGHGSINAGDGDLVFSNLAYIPCKVFYEPVQYYHGLAAFIKEIDEKIVAEPNGNHAKLPKIRYATPKENEELGIKFNAPVYNEFVKNPEKYSYLGNVDPYVDEIMSMFNFKEE